MESPAWGDSRRWQALCDASDCPICLRGHPLDLIAEFPATWASAGREAPLPGYACVVSKLHVVEPYELSSEDGSAFWEEAMVVARVLAELFQPVKMNYEIHGNVVPHLHLHLYPRFVADPYATGALRQHSASFTRTDEELAQMADALAVARERFAKLSQLRRPSSSPASPA
jgi:diadenosine tetraphosphate (Ap4A) HIT family hydrolase